MDRLFTLATIPIPLSNIYVCITLVPVSAPLAACCTLQLCMHCMYDFWSWSTLHVFYYLLLLALQHLLSPRTVTILDIHARTSFFTHALRAIRFVSRFSKSLGLVITPSSCSIIITSLRHPSPTSYVPHSYTAHTYTSLSSHLSHYSLYVSSSFHSVPLLTAVY